MQPSCFVTDGKEELMQTSKNHFEAKVIFNDETIRRMFRTEFYTYEGMQRLVWLAVAFALVMLALFVPIPTVVKVLCLLVGCAMFAMPDFLSRVAAEGVIMQRGGAESTVSCRINAGGVSVAALFMGGYLPGILMGLCVAGLAVFIAVKKGYKSSDVKDPDPAIKIIIDAVPSLLAVIIVMGGILAGFFTATEAGVVLCLYCGLLSILYKEMTLKSFYNLLADTMESSATILFLIAASSIMSYVMSYSGIPAAISNALMSVSSNRYVILLIMNVFLLVMGMFLDLTPAVLIFTPIFLPITRSIGMSDVQFGIMLIMNLGIGSVTPPVGSCLFVGCGVGKVKIEGVTKYIVPLFAAMVVALFLVTFIPAIALVVPYLCGLVPSLGWTM